MQFAAEGGEIERFVLKCVLFSRLLSSSQWQMQWSLLSHTAQRAFCRYAGELMGVPVISTRLFSLIVKSQIGGPMERLESALKNCLYGLLSSFNKCVGYRKVGNTQ